jgi:two-component system invasion response regulator UvrY
VIRILLVDDHVVVRSGYRRFLDAEPDFEVVAEAGRADDAYKRILEGGIDVAIIDLSMPGGSALELMPRIVARQPDLKILVFSMHDHSSFVTQAMRAGAFGYLSKCSEPAEMVRAIRDVAAGRRVFSADIAQKLAREAIDGASLLDRLTPREFEILRLAVQGTAPAEIAANLHLSPKTVRNNLTSVRQKLEVSSDFELFRIAVRNQIADL